MALFVQGDMGPVLKVLALFHGPDVLEAAIRVLVQQSTDPQDLRLVVPVLVERVRWHLSMHFAKIVQDPTESFFVMVRVKRLYENWEQYFSRFE